MGAIQAQRRGGYLGGHQWVDDDDSGVALDEGDVGEVQAADLIDARHHFVEALFGGQGRLPPQAGVHRCRRAAVEEGIRVVVPHHAAVGGLDDAWGQRGNESTIGIVEIGVSWNGRASSLCADSMTAVGGLWIHRQYLAIKRAPSEKYLLSDGELTKRNKLSSDSSSSVQLTRILPRRSAHPAGPQTSGKGEQVKRGLTVAVAGAAILAAGMSGCSATSRITAVFRRRCRAAQCQLAGPIRPRSSSTARTRTCRAPVVCTNGCRQRQHRDRRERQPASSSCSPTPIRPR